MIQPLFHETLPSKFVKEIWFYDFFENIVFEGFFLNVFEGYLKETLCEAFSRN